jgi:hypothetical protein
MKLKENLTWKTLGLAASALMLGTRLYADNSPTPFSGGPDFPSGDPGSSGLPLVNIIATDPTALEGTSSGAFTLIRSGPTTAALEVNLIISGSASNGVDYSTISSPVTIPIGSLAVDIPVTPILDTINRGNKTVQLAIETNSAYMRGGYRKATVEIIDDVFNVPPPSISLSAPTNGTSVTNPTTVTLTAEVSDTVPVTGVSFFADDFLLGKTNSPDASGNYNLVWNNPRPGAYVLFARMTDEVGHSAICTPVDITVAPSTVPVIKPEVSITSPVTGAGFTTGTDITITASVTDAAVGATIQSVTFYLGDTVLGTGTTTSTASPYVYTYTWSNAPVDPSFLPVALTAVATDSNNESGRSAPVFILVTRATPTP